MIPTDFNRARAAHSALQDFFAAHPKGKLERSALEHIHGLCHAAENAVSDDECRRAIRNIERYSRCSARPSRRDAAPISCSFACTTRSHRPAAT